MLSSNACSRVVRSDELDTASGTFGQRRLQFVSMKSLPEGWHVTKHATEKIVERGVRPDEVVDAIEHRQLRTPDEKGRPGCEVWWRDEVGVVVNPKEKRIITVLLTGGSKDDWHKIAEVRHRRRTALAEAMKTIASAPPRVSITKPARRRTALPAGIHPGIYKLALKQAGGDPDRLRILGPTRVEVLPVAS